jgi:hypothetical protein
MMRVTKTLAVLLAATTAVPANADDWGDTASGAISITVIIAPFGAAIAAAQEGAVGAWSVRGQNDGVLLGAPEMLNAGGVQNVSLFNNADAPLSLTSSNPAVTIAAGANRDFRGLKRQEFAIGLSNAQSDEPVTMVIGSI